MKILKVIGVTIAAVTLVAMVAYVAAAKHIAIKANERAETDETISALNENEAIFEKGYYERVSEIEEELKSATGSRRDDLFKEWGDLIDSLRRENEMFYRARANRRQQIFFEEYQKFFSFSFSSKEQEADAHDILGVAKNASKMEIKKAYRQKAAEFHPDKHVDKSAEEQAEMAAKFDEIRKAYETLTASK